MSYLGNNPDVNAFTVGVDKFNGTGACTQFTLTRSISDVNAIEVVVNGVQQEPTAAYTVSNGVITFDEAPSSGTNNIIVTYRAPIVVTFNQVTASQLQPNSVTQTAIAFGAVTQNAIASGAVTNQKIATNSITGNHITQFAISGNQIGLNAISGNLIGVGAISGNLIAVGAVSGNQIGLYAVSGNQIGLGAVSANNFAGGGITSNVLSSNLQISTSRVAETVNVVTSAIGGIYDIHLANSSVYYFVANTTANVTFNVRANTQNILDSIINTGQTASLAVALKQGSTRYRANIQIDGVLQTSYWLGNSQPLFQTSQPQSIDAYNFTIIKTASNTYTVLASNSTFAQANGQGMGVGGGQ